MKFTDKRTTTRVLFGDLKTGMCFITPSDSHINMKMHTDEYDCPDVCNTIDLVTGNQYSFEDDEEVIAVNAEIIITD